MYMSIYCSYLLCIFVYVVDICVDIFVEARNVVRILNALYEFRALQVFNKESAFCNN